MKKIFKFIINRLVEATKLLIVIILSFILFVYAFSVKNNITFKTTLSYLQSVGNELLHSQNIIKIPDYTTPEDSVQASTVPTPNNNYYYYSQLNNSAKMIYSTLEKNIDNLKKENYIIDFYNTFNDLLHNPVGQYQLNKDFQSALDAFFYDHPELFYIDLTKISLVINSISFGPMTTYTVQIAPKDNKSYLHDYFDSEEKLALAITKVENIKNKIIDIVKDYELYDQILHVHDMLVNSLKYDYTLSKPNIYNIYGALVEKEVVCEGYAKSFKYIMDALDVECILVVGTASSDLTKAEAHMWNYVKLDNKWYGVDVTWDDSMSGSGISSAIRHNYFLKGVNTFSVSHYPSGRMSEKGMLFSLPTLCDENYK